MEAISPFLIGITVGDLKDLSSYLEVVGIEYVVLPTTFSSMIHRSLFGRAQGGVDFQAS